VLNKIRDWGRTQPEKPGVGCDLDLKKVGGENRLFEKIAAVVGSGVKGDKRDMNK